jgi:glycosyltransferase involved in cell wall biosynthesis
MNKKVSFIYFSPLEYCNVFITQVVGWLNLFQANGIPFVLYRTVSIKKLFSLQEKLDTQKVKEVYKNSKGKLFLAPPKMFLGVAYNNALILSKLMRDFLSGKKVVLQIRSAELWKSFRIIKYLFPEKFILIYDSRAAAAEETKYLYTGKVKSRRIIKKINRTTHDEIMMVRNADKVFCVSNVLIDFHIRMDTGISSNKFFLYPCSADSSVFHYSETGRNEIRSFYNLLAKRILIYSGGLEMPWHIPEKMFEAASLLIKLNPVYFIIILSPDTAIAEKYAQKYNLSSSDILIKSVPNNEVSKFLSAADIAILLRDDVPMNNVASPSKFAEYLMCGLPVLISENVGDFSKFVGENNIGHVVSNELNQESIVSLNKHLLQKWDNFHQRRNEIERLGYSNFSKDVNIEKIISIYKSIIN